MRNETLYPIVIRYKHAANIVKALICFWLKAGNTEKLIGNNNIGNFTETRSPHSCMSSLHKPDKRYIPIHTKPITHHLFFSHSLGCTFHNEFSPKRITPTDSNTLEKRKPASIINAQAIAMSVFFTLLKLRGIFLPTDYDIYLKRL